MKNDTTKYHKIIIITSLAVLSFWGLTFFLLKSQSETFRGTFGDMFGAVNALFSGSAFAGIIISMYMQRDDLRNQREELKLQRKEQKDTRMVFEKQSQIMANQQNDSAFFNLLTNHRQLVESLKRNRLKPTYYGKNNHGSNSEIVSGYQVIEETANSWFDYFYEYSEMYKSKVIWNVETSEITAVELIKSRSNILTVIEETLHISRFIIERFKLDNHRKFYNETLSHNLLDSEKFILATWFAIVLNRRDISPFGMELFDDQRFIDFNKKKLPEVSIEVESLNMINHSIKVSTSGKVQAYYFVMKHEPSKDGERKLESKCIRLEKEKNELSISINDFARNTSLNIKSFPFEEEKLRGLHHRNYYIIIEVLCNNEIFSVPVQFNLREHADFQARINDRKFYNLTIENGRLNDLSDEDAIELIDQNKHIAKSD